jgi:RNA polymerase sigma factor (TIGR02999 family)
MIRGMGEVTTLLGAAGQGDRAALDRLFALMYDELRKLGRSRLNRSQKITLLDPTALVHECYLRFIKMGELDVTDRGQFLGYAARVMRFVVVDFVRQRQAERRGGAQAQVTLNTGIADSVPANEQEVIRISDLLEELAKTDERLVRVVEMRCFAGLTEVEIAATLGVTDRTVRRDWQKARMLLVATLE